MADLLSGAISFAGLGNGTDFGKMIDGLIDVERNRITSLESWKQEWTDKVDAFQDLNTKMLSLKTTLSGMDTLNEFMTKTASTSNASVVSAKADADASSSTHTIVVNQLAQNKIMTTSSGYANNLTYINQTGGDQDFAYTYKGKNYVVTIPDDTTIEGLVNYINKDADNPGVRAALVSDGNQYFLQFRGLNMGSKYSLEINDAQTTLTGFSSANFETVQTNQNSQIKVDGWPTGATSYISNASNTITTAIEGVTLNLKSASPGETITLTVDVDKESIKQNIRDFVDQINTVRQYIIDITKFDDVAGKGSILTGNYGVQIISQRLKDITASIGPGFDYYDTSGNSPSGDKYTALSQVGILTDASEGSATSGLLTLDEAALDEALDDDFDAVVAMFAADFNGGTRHTEDFAYISKVDTLTKAGTYDVSYKVDASGKIYDAYINGYAASVDNGAHTLTAQSHKSTIGDTKVEQNGAVGILLQVNNLTQGSYPPAGTSSSKHPVVYIQLGKSGELVESLKELTNENSGPLAILEDNYDDIMESIDKKIAYEENRITKLERTLRLKYARLDALLGNYENLGASLSGQISSLTDN
ncbi:MAG: flagellar filament capping protein FliD [Proteobacteria bacterium]|nr:flagellar filament capping protein FliD [Pseudomonadota bacterium]MBU1612760.1 flagellar filament capping protein FliD [Pseudomonadota bacterium]